MEERKRDLKQSGRIEGNLDEEDDKTVEQVRKENFRDIDEDIGVESVYTLPQNFLFLRHLVGLKPWRSPIVLFSFSVKFNTHYF